MGAATIIHVGRGLLVRIPDLVEMISSRANGAKLDVPALARALTPTQAEIVGAIRVAIDEGALDPQTLRRPVKITKVPPAKEFRPTGAELAAKVQATAAARGLTNAEACRQIFGNQAALWTLKRGVRPVSRKMYAKVQAWLDGGEVPPTTEPEEANPTSPRPAPRNRAAALTRSSRGAATQANRAALASAPAKSPGDDGSAARPPDEREPSSESAPPPALEVSSAQLLREIEAFCERSGMSHSAFGKRVKNDLGYVRRLRTGSVPKPRSVEQVRAFIRNWLPEDEPASAARRRRASSQEISVRRSITRQAEKFLDGEANGKTKGGAPNQAVLAVARQIEEKRAAVARQQDPVEIAKLALRRRGRVVYSCSVTGGRSDRFTVSGFRDETTGKNRQFDKAALIALARQVNPTAMEGVGA